MSTLADILKILEKIITLEGKAEEAIATEKDKSRREKIAKAFTDRDRAALASLLFDN